MRTCRHSHTYTAEAHTHTHTSAKSRDMHTHTDTNYVWLCMVVWPITKVTGDTALQVYV